MGRPSLISENDCGCVTQSRRVGAPVSANDTGCICLASSIVRIVGRKYSLRLLSMIADCGALRFNEIRREMSEISSSTLTIRLAELESAGLIQRQTFSEIPPRVEYSLTEEGEGLRKRLLSLSRFASRRRTPDV